MESEPSVSGNQVIRKRNRLAKKTGVPAIIDPDEYLANKCSSKAKKVTTEELNIVIDLWFDKHYHDRYQFGDEKGERIGINPDVVERFVRESFKYLILSSAIVKGFKFINYDSTGPATFVILKKSVPEGVLNVVIQTHFISLLCYEITVTTAMIVDDFKIAAGQYVIDFQDDAVSLKKFDNRVFSEIVHFDL